MHTTRGLGSTEEICCSITKTARWFFFITGSKNECVLNDARTLHFDSKVQSDHIMKLRASFFTFFSSLLGTTMLSAQINLTLDGTSGSNAINTSYSTNGGLSFSLGFFADYLVVGGGGGGGGSGTDSSAWGSGGGGAGGLLQGNMQLLTGNYSVLVGAGGSGGARSSNISAQQGSNGGNSLFGSVTAMGGGGGGAWKVAGNSGGSGGGGGGRASTTGGAGTSNESGVQGNAGGMARSSDPSGRSAGGGGGGAGSAGENGNQSGATIAGNGGSGLSSSITGTAVFYAGGGGGGAIDNYSSETAGNGGIGGGGAGSISGNASNGINGLGGGGGGAGTQGTGGNGGSGVVIVRYKGSSLGNVGGTVSAASGSADGYTIHTFTNTGAANFNMSGVDLNQRLGATLNSSITGDGDLSFSGPGTLTLGATNTYGGLTRVSGGTLRLTNHGSFGSGNVVNDSAVVIERADSFTLGNTISGLGSLTHSGNGTTIITGNNSYAGGTTISAGILQVGNGSNTGSLGSGGVVVSSSGASLSFNRSDNLTFDQNLTGSGRLVQAGTGTLSILSNNSNTGGTVVSSGVLKVGNGGTSGALGTGNISISSGATLAYDRSDSVTLGNALSGAGSLRQSGAGSLIITANSSHTGGTIIDNGRILQIGAGSTTGSLGSGAVTNNGTLVYNRSGFTTFANNISGTGSLEVTSTASFTTLSGSNTYSGSTRIRGTEITVGQNALAGSTLTTFTEDRTSTLEVKALNQGSTYHVGGLAGNRGIHLNSGLQTVNVGGNNESTSLGGSLSAAGSGGFNKVGSGTLSLSGNANNFVKGMNIRSGAIELAGGSTTVFEVLRVGQSSGDNGTLLISGGSHISSAFIGGGAGSSGTMTMTGGSNSFGLEGIRVGDGGVGTFNLAGGVATGSLASVGYGTGSVGTLNVSGGTMIVSGSLQFGRGSQSSSTLNLTGGQIIAGSDARIGTGIGNTTVLNISGGSLEHRGSEDFLLNAFTGTNSNVTINLTGAGLMSSTKGIAYYSSSSSSSATINIGNGGTAGSLNAPIVALVGPNSALNFNHNNAAYNLTASIVGDPLVVSQHGSGKTILSGSNLSWRGGTVINAGTLQVGNGGSHSSAWAVSNIINNGTLSLNASNSSTVVGVISGTGSLLKEGTGTLTLYGDNTYTGSTTINDGALRTSVWSSAGGPMQFGRLHSSSALIVNSNGSFLLGGAQTLGSLSGSGTISLGVHQLTLNAVGDSQFSGGIHGTGGFTKEGSGTFTLSGTNQFKGETLVNAGRLVLSGTTALGGASVVKVNTGGTLEVTQRVVIGFLDLNGGTVIGGENLVSSFSLINDGTVSGLVDGADFAAGILKRTSGIATVDGANTYTGTTKIEAGIVRLEAGGSFAASSSLLLESGGTMNLNGFSQTFSALDGKGGAVVLGSGDITVNSSGNSSFSGVISGSGRLIKSGSGVLTLTGANSHSGGYEVTGGRLIGNTTSLSGNIANQGTVEFRQESDSALGANITGAGALVKSGIGTMTISTNTSYTGSTTVESGTLIISGSTTTSHLQVGSNATLVMNGSTGNSSALQVDGNATLKGSGTIGGTSTISGIHSPGNSPGIQTFTNNLTYNSGSNIIWELISNNNTARGTDFDGIDVGGNLNFAGPTTITLDFALAGSSVDWLNEYWGMDRLGTEGWKIFDVNGTVSGLGNVTIAGSLVDASGDVLPSLRPSSSFYLTQEQDGVYLNYSAIPEPSNLLLGLAGAALLYRRKRHY